MDKTFLGSEDVHSTDIRPLRLGFRGIVRTNDARNWYCTALIRIGIARPVASAAFPYVRLLCEALSVSAKSSFQLRDTLEFAVDFETARDSRAGAGAEGSNEFAALRCGTLVLYTQTRQLGRSTSRRDEQKGPWYELTMRLPCLGFRRLCALC